MSREYIEQLVQAELARGAAEKCSPYVRHALETAYGVEHADSASVAPAVTSPVAILYADDGYGMAEELVKHMWLHKPRPAMVHAGDPFKAELLLVLLTADMMPWLDSAAGQQLQQLRAVGMRLIPVYGTLSLRDVMSSWVSGIQGLPRDGTLHRGNPDEQLAAVAREVRNIRTSSR